MKFIMQIAEGAFNKYVRSKFQILVPPLFIPVHFTCTCTPSTYVRFSELTHSQKQFCDVYEFSNEKSGGEKREKN